MCSLRIGGSRQARLGHAAARGYHKDVIFDLIDKMNRGAVDILLGTQMVAKGFDFHRVSTVGVILADIGINLPDFRSAERIFSLLMQVAGRCGRGSVAGKVIVQTLNDEHYLFDFLKGHDYYGFYRHELSMRKLMDYPPFSRIIRLLVRGRNEEKVVDSIAALSTAIKEEIRRQRREISVLGPSPAPLPRIAGNYRYHLLLKSKDIDGTRAVVKSVKRGVGEGYGYLEIDIDPHEIL
jgi:primosomal protein N' (replication factor Y)